MYSQNIFVLYKDESPSHSVIHLCINTFSEYISKRCDFGLFVVLLHQVQQALVDQGRASSFLYFVILLTCK